MDIVHSAQQLIQSFFCHTAAGSEGGVIEGQVHGRYVVLVEVNSIDKDSPAGYTEYIVLFNNSFHTQDYDSFDHHQ